MKRLEDRVANRLAVALCVIGALGWWSFFGHHHLELSAWVSFGSLLFLAFAIWRWGLTSIYLPGLITGIGIGYAVGIALWKHHLFLVLGCFIVIWLLAVVFWWRIAPVPISQEDS